MAKHTDAPIDKLADDEPIELTIRDMEDGRPQLPALSSKAYERQLRDLQIELLKLQKWVKDAGERMVIVFEGRDAAGKGGAIRRFMENINPRGARVVALTTPNDTERGQWYFQRYTLHLPTRGEIVLFDRSWYNRAGVERVMGYCTPREYTEFFRQAPGFERSLVQSGIHVFKLWFAVGQEEQARRFEARKSDPLRQWKLSPIDQAAMELYDEYGAARDAMLFYTDHRDAPWTVINSNDKKRARLESIRHVLSSMNYEHKDPAVARAADPRVVQPASAVMQPPAAPSV